jgi:hypothetical protein
MPPVQNQTPGADAWDAHPPRDSIQYMTTQVTYFYATGAGFCGPTAAW